MKNTNHFVLLCSAFLLGFASCKKENNTNAEPITLDCNSFKSNNANKITRLEDRGKGVDYIISCKAAVEIDLTIDPGVTIEFATGAGLEIATTGSVQAIGTVDDKIIFTGQSKTAGAWAGLLLRSSSVRNVFTHTLIDYAGGGSFNSNGDLGSFILWSNAYLRLNNSTISNSAEYGINANYSDYNVELNNCTINGCKMPFYGDANIAHRISGGNFTGNTTNAIRLRSDAGNRKISTSQTWSNLGVPYRIASTSDQLQIRGGSLTIQPGVTVEFETGQGIRVGDNDASTLIAVGTSTNPIIFTGVDKMAGAWKNISFHFTKSPLNEIAYATIEYAGNSGSGGAVYMWANPVIKVSNVAFNQIGTCALYAAPNSSNPNTNLNEANNTTTSVAGGYLCGQ